MVVKKIKNMKKVFLAIGIISFLLVGAISIESVVANQSDASVYDDPPKKDASKKKSCAKYEKSSCCKKKSAKSDCKDKSSDKKESEGTKSTSKNDTPDKK